MPGAFGARGGHTVTQRAKHIGIVAVSAEGAALREATRGGLR